MDRKSLFSESRSRSPDLAGDSIMTQNTVSTTNRTQTRKTSRAGPTDFFSFSKMGKDLAISIVQQDQDQSARSHY